MTKYSGIDENKQVKTNFQKPIVTHKLVDTLQ